MGSRPSSFMLSTPGAMRLYSTVELLAFPPPEWLIDDILTEGGLAALYAPPESYKSFLAIDLALSVATATPWHGHAVRPGFVLYVASEGGPGIGKRARAWLRTHNIQANRVNMGWMIESVSVYGDSEDMTLLEDRLDVELERTPSLVIIDTLARCFDGDENQQEDMGRFVAGMDRLRHKYGATVLAVHHTRLDGDRERGNTALRGGMDTMLSIERQDSALTVSCAKQKDAEHFANIELEFQAVEGTDSGIVAPSKIAASKAEKTQWLWGYLRDNGPLTWDQWVQGSTLPPTTFKRYHVDLVKNRKIIKENGKWHVIGVHVN